MKQENAKEKQRRQNIGELIQEELLRQERSVSWFARKLCCDRSNIYKLFQRSNIDTELLWRISVILQHDFFKDLSTSACGEFGNRTDS